MKKMKKNKTPRKAAPKKIKQTKSKPVKKAAKPTKVKWLDKKKVLKSRLSRFKKIPVSAE